MVVVRSRGEQWRRTLDLRVEDDPEPLAELRRLVRMRQAYDLSERADELIAEGRADEAGLLYRRASEVAPDNEELAFWAGLALVDLGDRDNGLARVRAAIDVNPALRELLDRLSPELFPSAPAVREALSG
jgi:tetratricopeptide (TPR) repeat protein